MPHETPLPGRAAHPDQYPECADEVVAHLAGPCGPDLSLPHRERQLLNVEGIPCRTNGTDRVIRAAPGQSLPKAADMDIDRACLDINI